MKLICGIDEAGRGAVIGPLVVAGVFIQKREEKILKEIGVKDSKLLSPQKREEIFKQLKRQKTKFHFFEISPKAIDSKSINELEIEAARKLIKKFEPQRIFLDVPAAGKGIENYCNKLREKVGKGIEVIGGNKFDSLHLVVGAASIVAKVMRDRAIARLKKKYGDFGSGYPNERTITYLRANYEKLKPIVRMKWKTIRDLRFKK
ncbi:MAG: ribonuclease HII [Candidatus Portnoybacteria bacterium]|nr:ribonuclease HII [Candidatus Portnoybacteria bacterium]